MRRKEYLCTEVRSGDSQREENKRTKRESWYKKKGSKTVLFVSSTPGSKLRKLYEEEISKTNIKMKVVERAGPNLKKRLQRSNPFGSQGCGKSDCLVCGNNNTNERKKGMCRRENITYEIECSKCNEIYIGESARNAYARGKEHLSELIKKNPSSVLYRHLTEKHNTPDERDNHTPKFHMRVTNVHKDALSRQLTEAVCINKRPATMNSRHEYNHTRLPRAVLMVT